MSQFPNLSAARALCVDVETKDNGITLGRGAGWALDDGGYVCGLAISTDDGHRWYFPVRHEQGQNLPPESVWAWAREELGREHQPKIGANLMYDEGWLLREGVPIKGVRGDVQFAEALLDEHRFSYSLGSLAQSYGLTDAGKGAPEEQLYQYLAQHFRGKPTRKAQAKNIWRAPGDVVASYALEDVRLPFEIWRRQAVKLQAEDLMPLYSMECALIPLLVKMRMRGVRVDTAGAQAVSQRMEAQRSEYLEKLRELTGSDPDVNSPLWLKATFDKQGIAYPTTGKGNPSFTKEFLGTLEGELPQLITSIRRIEKAKSTFIDGGILAHADQKGRIHAEFHPLRSDNGGAISGRFSCSNPNLQNQPSRDEELAPLIRGLFIPDNEDEEIHAHDYSQIEYRFMVHSARGPGAEEARERYRKDPRTDYHDMAGQLIEEVTGQHLGRKAVKNVNFGKIFGMGKAKLRRSLGLSQEEAERFFQAYDTGIPYAKHTLDLASNLAAQRGFIRTVLRRRQRFPFWESRDWKKSQEDGYMTRVGAVEKYGVRGIRRARTHKAINAYTQGSGADVIKKAMLDCYEQLGEVPLVTVHDELVWSLPKGEEGERRGAAIKEVMEHTVQISVPLLVDWERGPNWGNVS